MDFLNERQKELVEVTSFKLDKVVTGEKAASYNATRLRGTVFNGGDRIVFWRNKKVEVINIETSEIEDSIDVDMDNVYGMLYFRSKNYLVLSGRGFTDDTKFIIKLMDIPTKKIVGCLNAHRNSVFSMIEVPDSILISGGFDRKLIVWDLEVERTIYCPKYVLDDYNSTLRTFAHVRSSRNSIVSVGGEVPGNKETYLPYLWDYDRGILKAVFMKNENAHDYAVFCSLTFMREGVEYLVTGGFSRFCVWNISTLSLTRSVGADNDVDYDRYSVSMMLFNSKYLVVMNVDDCIRLWNIEEDVVLRKEHGDEVGRIGFSSSLWWRNGECKQFVSFNDTICLWKLEFENYDLVRRRYSDEKERKEFVHSEEFFNLEIKMKEMNNLSVYKSLMIQ